MFRKTGDVSHLGVVEVQAESSKESTPAVRAAYLLRGQTLSLDEADELRRVIDAASKTAQLSADRQEPLSADE